MRIRTTLPYSKLNTMSYIHLRYMIISLGFFMGNIGHTPSHHCHHLENLVGSVGLGPDL